MAAPINSYQDVARYVTASLALLVNSNVFLHQSNKKFLNFQNTTGNLGSSITYKLPTRYRAQTGLVANFQSTTDRVQTLTVNDGYNVPFAYTGQEKIFNVDHWLDDYARSAIAELGAVVEGNVAGLAETAPYRFFGDGTTAINTTTQLATIMSFFRDYGAANNNFKAVIPEIEVPAIVGSSLTQFVMDRNEKAANSWELGTLNGTGGTNWYCSNLLPRHVAGNVGNNGTTLTVVSINAAGDQITVNTGGGADPDAIKQYDSIQFNDGVGGQPNMRYLTFIGHQPSANPVQVQATADAAADVAGNITIPITPALNSTANDPFENINNPVAAGMELSVLPTHRCGLVWSGNALFLGMPSLPKTDPFESHIVKDPKSGAAMRMYTGNQFGMNEYGSVFDTIWAKDLPGEYCMKIAFPDN